MKLGIDFGTTNSAVAALEPGARPHILQLAPGQPTQRTVIYAAPGGDILFGNEAFAAYLEQDMEGRFLRSIKAFLPHEVPKTALGGRQHSLVDIVAFYLGFLIRRAEEVLGERVTEVVVGRPVRFHADDARHAHALDQLQQAIAQAELPQASLQLEPVAAAHRYEQGLEQDRTVLVGDFGGGTADFALIRVGPGRRDRGDRTTDVLGTSGVPLAGDAIDGRFMEAFVVPFFGEGATFLPPRETARRSWSPSVLRQLDRLYDLHRLRDPQLERYLTYIEDYVDDPAVVRRLRRLVFDDLGYPMAAAIEAAKRRLSTTPHTIFRFDEFYTPQLDIETEVQLPVLEDACAAILGQYRDAIDAALSLAGAQDREVDEIFLTGGTSQLPFVQALFTSWFGAHKLRSADAFTTVCEGLALS